MSAHKEDPWGDEVYSRRDSWRSRIRHDDYPPELNAWAAEVAKEKAAKAAADAVLCGRCGKPRGHGDHKVSAQVLSIVRCRFVEVAP